MLNEIIQYIDDPIYFADMIKIIFSSFDGYRLSHRDELIKEFKNQYVLNIIHKIIQFFFYNIQVLHCMNIFPGEGIHYCRAVGKPN